jgi:hypothetical protein
MGLAMAVVVAVLAAATGLEALGAPHTLWMTAIVGALGALGGGVAMELLRGAARH